MRNALGCIATVLLALMPALPASAQNSTPQRLGYVIPQLFGPDGLTLPNKDHLAHFDNDFQADFVPFNTAIANQLASLPLPSPAAGFTYMFDSELGVYTRSAKGFGPILSERAETMGKDKFYAGFTFQHFRFTSIDGLDMNAIPSVFRHTQTTPDPLIKQDVITTNTRLDSQIGQFTSFFTYGLSNRLDVSVAIPLIDAKISATSTATIRRVGTANDPTIHFFLDQNGNATDHKTFSSGGSATGLGDVLVRAKSSVIEGSAAWLGAGVDVRMPTGDAFNFLGSGAVGVRPYITLSGRSRVSPHIDAGYQWNGNSVLAGDLLAGTRGHLPDQITWAAGFDAGIREKFSFAADVLGQTILHANTVRKTTFTAADNSQWANTDFVRKNSQIINGSAGFKINPTHTLLISFNALFKLNEQGLRSSIVPLIGMSYSF